MGCWAAPRRCSSGSSLLPISVTHTGLLGSLRDESRDRVDLARAALLHDVGKRHAQLGIFGRVLASLLRQVGLRGSGRIARYLDHPAIGGAELEEAGSDRLVIEFALHHHGDRPGTIQPDDWALLVAADHATGGRFAE